ncbi:MAG: UPF0182 family protein [Myxococcales bacterium]|nr:MAG: UPF0182 family protein [Myxococcales bacterium]
MTSLIPKRPRFMGFIVLGIVFLAFITLPTLARIYTEFLWFKSLGQGAVFTTLLTTKVWLGFAIALLTFAFVFVNSRLAIKLSHGLYPVVLRDPNGVVQINAGKIATKFVWPVSLLATLFLGFWGASLWNVWLRSNHSVSFGQRDPLFGRDVAFYMFDLPLLEMLTSLGLTLLVPTVGLCVLLYFARGALVNAPNGPRVEKHARIHLSILLALLFLMLACKTYLQTTYLLFSESGPVSGASYTDVFAKLPALQIKAAIAVVAALLVLGNLWRQRFLWVGIAFALYVSVEILGVRVYPNLVHKFTVVPNEYEKEAPFIRHNIEATRQAFALDKVKERDLTADVTLTIDDINRNQATIENIRLWDHAPLLDTFAQIQEIRTYYDFTSVDNDRYVIDGKLRQTMLSPRELASESLPNRTWINERFTFTHGYGLTLGPVNRATPEGLPELFIKDIPPQSSIKGLNVSNPAIYYGELTSDYVFVDTRNREFHHPSGDKNVYAKYKGKGGVSLSSFLTRLALSIQFGSIKLLLSEDIQETSRVLLHRNIQERIRNIAPFLLFDQDPYMVIRDNGQLVWLIDAYTIANRYPYAQSVRAGINYMRNSVKVVVDAYDGSVDFYVADTVDPVLKVWQQIFPTLFKSLQSMPKDIKKHLRYPLDIFEYQTEMMSIYHMKSAELLYNREDQWEIPAITNGENRTMLEPYYTVMKLPQEKNPEFILMLPFTPKRKDNLAAWMVARNDGEHLGELVVYSFPKDRLIFGPQQIANRINQDAEISRQISLWDQRGSQAILGTLLVIPIEEALIYVQPLYLRSEGGRIPELKRVVVAYENRIAMAQTLEAAIADLFGGETATSKTVSSKEEDITLLQNTQAQEFNAATEEKLLNQQALNHYRQAIQAQKEGDWSRYGEELKALGNVLERMQ